MDKTIEAEWAKNRAELRKGSESVTAPWMKDRAPSIVDREAAAEARKIQTEWDTTKAEASRVLKMRMQEAEERAARSQREYIERTDPKGVFFYDDTSGDFPDLKNSNAYVSMSGREVDGPALCIPTGYADQYGEFEVDTTTIDLKKLFAWCKAKGIPVE